MTFVKEFRTKYENLCAEYEIHLEMLKENSSVEFSRYTIDVFQIMPFIFLFFSVQTFLLVLTDRSRLYFGLVLSSNPV